MSDLSIQYLAGLMDGDGCFYVRRWNNKHGGLGFRAEVTIVLRRDKKYLLNAIHEKHGGFLADRNPRPPSKPISRLDWGGSSAHQICKLLFPFLIIKREQAQVVIDFEELRIRYSPQLLNRDKNGKLLGFGPDYLEEAEMLYGKCRKLKEYIGG
jgi:hypothetical protein